MRLNYRILTVISGVLITFIQPEITKAICSNNQVDGSAEKITVLINSKEPGSGVIIKRTGNTYTVLTAYHVVKNPKFKYEILTVDKQTHQVNYQTVKRLANNIDLAILEFTSHQNYQIAKLSNSEKIKRRTKLYVSGYPVKTGAIKASIYDCRDGKVIDNLTKNSINNNGYNLIYDNPTLPGMSGGAVLNDAKQLIGIHGRGEGATDITSDAINPDVGIIKSGRNLGIPSSVFLPLLTRIGVNVDMSSPTEEIVTTGNNTDKLEELLSQGNWKEADQETKSLLFAMTQSSNTINEQGISRLSCTSLSRINQMWKTNSQGRFGFTVQAQKWKSLFGTKFEPTNEHFEDFATEVGWRYRGRFLHNDKINYSLNAPLGHLPRLFLDGPIWGKFIAYLDSCKI
ncbi:GUN4 domain-containing protein [Anabaena sp. AL09]|uniref:GUN4 domain-containing protein n=1 Tax=Anabaena sp. AL09 TaxID=1710891 RepID=UPI000AB7F7B1|nr:GUN4 domain-containing protein [Anabaena sp. AL09]